VEESRVGLQAFMAEGVAAFRRALRAYGRAARLEPGMGGVSRLLLWSMLARREEFLRSPLGFEAPLELLGGRPRSPEGWSMVELLAASQAEALEDLGLDVGPLQELRLEALEEALRPLRSDFPELWVRGLCLDRWMDLLEELGRPEEALEVWRRHRELALLESGPRIGPIRAAARVIELWREGRAPPPPSEEAARLRDWLLALETKEDPARAWEQGWADKLLSEADRAWLEAAGRRP